MSGVLLYAIHAVIQCGISLYVVVPYSAYVAYALIGVYFFYVACIMPFLVDAS